MGLSRLGIDQFFYWQWATYFLIQPSVQGISFSLFLQLGLSLYLIWIFGTSLMERLGQTKFFALFLGSALAAGLAAWGALEAGRSSHLFLGPSAPLYACLFAWTLLNENASILLFFAVPIKARSALYVLLGGAFFIYISQSDWPSVAALFAAIAYAYLFILITCRIRSPFPFLHPFERALMRCQNKEFPWGKKKNPTYHASKIYDIRSGEPILNDEQFMDAMLTRISLYGEDSLSSENRKRMTEISHRKKNKKST